MPSNVTIETDRRWLDLSLAQQAVWLDAKLSGASAYQLGGWARIDAHLDEAAVRQALSLIMARHDGLRLRVDDELPRQWLDESVDPPLTILDLPGGTQDPDSAFQSLVDDRFSSGLALGDHCLFAVEIIRAGGNLSYMLWRFHHLVADNASVAITINHWLQAYEALTAGTPQELATPSSYLKTISSDAAYLESTTYQKDLAYWTARFDPLPPALIADLEFHPSNDVIVPAAHWTLAGAEFSAFQEAAKAAGSNVQRALFALFTMAMSRRYGQSDIVSGIALHRRDLANRYTVGMLAGVIPLRIQFDLYWTLTESVQAYSEQMDRDLRHQRLPVDVLSRALGLANTGRASLFEFGMSYMPSSRGWSDAVLEGMPVITGAVTAKEATPFSLQANESESGDALAIIVSINTDYVDAAEAQAVLTLLQTACRLFADEPETRFEDLPTISPAEHSLAVVQWNDTRADFETGTLDSLFVAQARHTPDAIAVIDRDGQPLTYAELDEQSTRLARALAAHGVKPERVVGVRTERSSETIIAFLAILKAGGVYLPLDPAYPQERLEYLIEDAGATLVLDSIHCITGDADLPADLADPRRIAYIIYTSGTTGLPKGVAVPHSSAVNLVFARSAGYDPLAPGDRVLAVTSVSFDMSIEQLLFPLMRGATVVIAGDVRTLGEQGFWDLVVRERVTHIDFVPSFIDSILSAAPNAADLPLKRLMLGGEALSGALLGRLRAAFPGLEIVNVYGPTETCIDATYYLTSEIDTSLAILPIGRPLRNYRAYILNELLEPVGIGISGELYVGGAGLARGYVNRPDLTSERFVADPFSTTPGDRLYRTGDRARWRPDGAIEFLGRVDYQVKIRGFRVEPGEIAAALLLHPAVAQSVVVPRAQHATGVQLVAYVVPSNSDAPPEAADLRTFLAGRLPDYMVPAALVFIPAIPLNRNGKLDEKALPSPDLRENEFIAPRTPTEETVARLFAEVLGLDRCGATDHFFQLGGHSLLATSLLSKLRGQGVKLPLRDVFEYPTVESLARRIDSSLPASQVEQVIVPQTRPDEIPLSFSQERIWFVDRLQQDASYNIPIALELLGSLNIEALERALTRIIARHESLRTRILLDGPRPSQQILPPADLHLAQIDLPSNALDAYLKQFAAHRFNLGTDLPLEIRLLAIEPQRHILAAVIHHVAFDGWSAALFFHEFSILYNAFSQNQADPLPAPALQYADFAIWQREQNREPDLAFWLQEMQGAPPQSALPADLLVNPPAHPVQQLNFDLSPELHSSLLRVANDSGVSLFMLLHAAFVALLSRWSGQEDVVIGTVVANRSRTEFESIIGCFINTLALRTTFQKGETFLELLRRVKNVDLAAFSHQDLPFEQLVEALQPERSLQHTPVFQVMLVLQNAPEPVGEFTGLTIQPVPTELQAPQFDLTLNLTEQHAGLAGAFVFSTSRYAEATIERFAGQFRRALEAVAHNPSQQVSSLAVLDPAERAKILNDWSGEERAFPQVTLDALFAQQVRANPSALAIIAPNGRQVTYAELDAESTRIARYLVSQGVGHESVVAVRMERSAETIIAFLAILKAGGVYLPLDPSYPADRLEFMIANSGALFVLDSLPTGEFSAHLPINSDPLRLAYIIYTSGTTGQPKGVAVSHSAAVNLAFARQACHDPLSPGDRVMAVTSVSFDVSIGQLLFPLFRGAAVVVAGDLKILGGAGFWALIAQQRVTHINFVPSFVESVLDSAREAGPLPLRRLMLGGEALTGTFLKRIHENLPGVQVVNCYGPTEACIDATYHEASSEDLSADILPIGRPLTNYRVYILDAGMEPVGVGVMGELYIGGASLARGYVKMPELTAEKFVRNPFSDQPDARLYRSGDLARWRADGNIEFLGRIDEQVKIRGFRVEPAEVEAQLRKQPGVRDGAVIAHKTSADVRLIAYYTTLNAEATAANLREGMAAVLPPYMVPAAFIELDEIPISANGKLDRKALPDPGHSAFTSRSFEAPVGPVEEKMAALWAGLLKHERVGRHDNFFELGGHSLLAVTLMERTQQEGLPGDIRALFTTPTIAGLAASLKSQTSHEHPAPANLITPGATSITPEMLPLVKLTQPQIDQIVANIPGGISNLQDIYPLAPLQEGIFFQYLMTPLGDPYLTPTLLSFDTRERLQSFLNALNTVTQRHDVLRTGVIAKGLDEPVQFVVRRVSIPIEELHFARSQDVSTELLAHFDSRSYRMDLSIAPLVRVAFSSDAQNNRWLLLLLSHHLILDHTAQEILVLELRALMADAGAVLPPALPYRNFIHQTQVGDTRDAQEAFFSALLSDIDEPTAPFGLLDTHSDGSEIEEAALPLDPALARQIRQHSRALGITPASIFHLAWAAVLAHVSNKSSVVFGTILFGRMRSGVGSDRVVGMFINTLPVRIDVDETALTASLVRTHQLLSELLLHEHTPLVLAQRSSGVAAPAPLFSSLFNYRYSPESAGNLEWPGVEMINGSERTNYPLSMAVDDTGSGFVLRSLAHPFAGAARVCRYLQQALKVTIHLLENEPNCPAKKIQVLPRTERHTVLEEWNHTDAKFEQGTLDGLFAAQTRRTPNAIAVIGHDGAELTYAQIDSQSTLLARRLVAQGVGLEKVVGVRMQRSTETIIALLAILKAGGVYLPLDPAYPPDRLAYMAQDAGAMLILDSIRGLSGEADLPQLSSPSRLAYIIYTSGTTGRPKGVAVPHSAPVNLAFARRACHDPIGPGDRILAAISVGFDVSIGQLLLPLLSGATVVISGDIKNMAPTEFWSFLAQRNVTHINSVPSFLDSILDSAPLPATLSLKRLMLGGEGLSGSLVSRIQHRLPSVDVVNVYGPTEACIDATYHVATQSDLTAAVLPIGRPLSNYRTYVLDQCLEPVGVGVSGELFLGGYGLARGYVNAPELTADRFIADPFAATPDAKLYRTGDLARWRADGCLEFLGRVDQQVKIRGFRVEPAEIEAQLHKHPGVLEAAVIPLASPAGTRLVAYFCGDETVEIDALRQGLAIELPDYMVPSAFVKLDKLPLSPNGKLDRKALPHPDKTAFAAHAFEPPIGDVEHKLAALWVELLRIEQVGRHDNFFELGGHSLLAMTLIERMQQQGIASDVRALFSTPTIAGIAAAATGQALQAAAPENRILPDTLRLTPEMLPLVTLTQLQLDKIVAAIPGGASNIQDIYPLSPLQQGILFEHLVTTEGDPYLAPFLLAFDHRERLNAFVEGLHVIADRHDVLRTAIVSKDIDAPLQIVLRRIVVPVEHLSLDETPGSPAPESQLLSRFDPNSFRFDLSQAPLLRAFTAFDPTSNRWLLLMLTHHLILDHTSLAIVVDELRSLTLTPHAQLSPPVPYRNFIAQVIREAPAAEHDQFFRNLLGDVDEPTTPFSLTDTQAKAADTTESSLRLDLSFSQRLREQARLLGVTPASLFHVAWAAVLSFVSGKSDVVFGTVLLGRMRSGAGADRAVGMFINTLPIRFSVDQTGVKQSVLAAQSLLAELMAHEHAPLALAQRASAVPPPAPLFSSLLNYRYSPEDAAEMAWPGVEMIYAAERTNYPVSMGVDDAGSFFTMRALAHPTAGAARVNQYLLTALEGILTSLETAPLTKLCDVPVISQDERRLVVSDWNRTSATFKQGTLDALFSEQARQTPNAVAIVSQDGASLTYAELDAQSTRLARQLVANGVAHEKVVGVRMERSTETIIAFLAILKAGGVYLPLDPAYPADRLAYMAQDSAAHLILESIHSLTGDADLPSLSDPNRLAYIIYTSGTTGKPKGVAVPHTAPVNLAFARRAAHDPIGVGDRILAAISVGFDVSIGQLLLPLLSGATIVIAPDLKTLGPVEFWSLLAERQVTHINSVPSFFDSILDAAPAASTLALKRLMLGGEPFTSALVSRIQNALPNTALVNVYGPTEACIDATCHIATEADLHTAVLPIGRPLSNYTAYILNARQQPAGVGIPGELYLGGAGLARGYVNAPELTAERFIADPFSNEPNARLYRTGDRAQWRSDGAIEFLGRVDKQVKIRGHRIELGEIEAALLEHQSIARVAVIADDSQPGATRLLAYLVPQTGSSVPDTQQLRSDLAAHLPEYMIPAAFFALAELPLTPNGKLDIRALPKPSVGQISTVEFVAPRTLLEAKLQHLWEEILNLRPIGIHDNFFSLGGHSLAVMRLINSCNAQFQTNLSLRVVFESPTIAQLAAALENAAPASESHICLVQLRPGNPEKAPLFCVHAAGGNVLGYAYLANALKSDRPVYGLQNRALFPNQPLATTIEALAADFIEAVRTVQPHGPYQMIGRSVGGLISYEMAQQLRAQGEEVSLVGLLDSLYPNGHFEDYTPAQRLEIFAGNYGLNGLFTEPQGPPQTLADLLERGRKIRPEYEGVDFPQFERFYAIYWRMAEFSALYAPKPYQGRVAYLRALKRLGPSAALPHEWSKVVDPAQTTVLDFDCEHDDFKTEWMAPTVAEHLETIMQAAEYRIRKPVYLLPLQTRGLKRNLFCVHPAGGRAFCYLPLSQELGIDQPLYGLQASGLEPGEPLPATLQQMAAEYIIALRETQPSGPYKLLGMSSGGVIALEMAQQLKTAGEDVSLVALLDTTVPGHPALASISDEDLLEAMQYELNCDDLTNEPPATLSELVALALKAGRVPQSFTLANAERIAAVFKNTVQLQSNYQPRPWSGRSILLRATKRHNAKDPLPDWSPYLSHLRVNNLAASHYDLVTPAFAPTVAALLRPYLK